MRNPSQENSATAEHNLPGAENSVGVQSLAVQGGLSQVCGSTTDGLWHLTIPDFLARTVADHGFRPAVAFDETGEEWTYRELSEHVDVLAAGLLALGVTKGDRVAIWAPNCPQWVAVQFATARIGAVLVNINPAYRTSELEYALNKVGAKVLFLADSFKTSNYLEMMETLVPELNTVFKPKGGTTGPLRSKTFPELKTIVQFGSSDRAGMLRYDDVMALAGPAWSNQLDKLSASLDPGDAINIQFTSGTTGAPKGATLSHVNIVNNAKFVVDRMGLKAGEALCIPVPLYHCFGMVMGVLGCVSVGAKMVFPGRAFEPLSTLGSVARHRCNALYGVPTMFVAMLEHPAFASFDLGSLRTGIMAGAPCPIEIMRRVIDEMHMSEVTIAYGMTETSPVSCQSHPDDPIDRRVSTVGRVHPHVDIKIVDESGQICPVGVQGEFCTRGYSVMKSYWDDDEQTQASIRDGWMHTGDLAVMDEAGYCAITGRVKDMIIRGGENIYPKEIEDFLFRHPDVQMAQVFGIPDDKYGEEICAWVVPKAESDLTDSDIIEFCRGQIAHFKVPRHVRVVSEIPMTVTGKPKKFVMREEMIKAFRQSA